MHWEIELLLRRLVGKADVFTQSARPAVYIKTDGSGDNNNDLERHVRRSGMILR